MNAQAQKLMILLLLVCLLLAACGGQEPAPITVVVTPVPVITVVVTPPPPGAEPTPVAETPTQAAPAAGLEILDATFAHGLDEEMQPIDPGSGFDPAETIYLSLKLKGRPKEGVVTARFFYADTLIAEAGVDLGDTNSGLLFSFGEDTYVGYTLTHEQPFPAGEEYYAEVYYDTTLLATYPFQVIAPAGALVSRIHDVLLALDADDNYNPIQPTTVFASDEEVHLVGEGDLITGSSLQAEWYVAGAVDPAGTRVITLDQDIEGAGFVFSYLPAGGWPVGEHSVVLTLDGEEIGRFPFAIIDSGGAAPLVEPDFWDAFPLPNDAEIVEVVEGVDVGFATAMPESYLFEYYGAWLRGQGWEMVTAEGAAGLIQNWTKEGAMLRLESQGIDDQGRTVVWAQFQAP
ncbi:MAG: hypothetical protein JXA93_03980 [Anaerolineae bacterium]|nr:hypothetical protein [Anaerolineae bacterium]